MTKMSIQEMFTTIIVGLRKQGRKSGIFIKLNGGYSQCKIMDADGNRCAIGQLIPIKEYNADYEDLLNAFKFLGVNHLSREADFLKEMGKIHDYKKVEEWEKAWAEVALMYNLVIPPLNVVDLEHSNDYIIDRKPLTIAQ